MLFSKRVMHFVFSFAVLGSSVTLANQNCLKLYENKTKVKSNSESVNLDNPKELSEVIKREYLFEKFDEPFGVHSRELLPAINENKNLGSIYLLEKIAERIRGAAVRITYTELKTERKSTLNGMIIEVSKNRITLLTLEGKIIFLEQSQNYFNSIKISGGSLSLKNHYNEQSQKDLMTSLNNGKEIFVVAKVKHKEEKYDYNSKYFFGKISLIKHEDGSEKYEIETAKGKIQLDDSYVFEIQYSLDKFGDYFPLQDFVLPKKPRKIHSSGNRIPMDRVKELISQIEFSKDAIVENSKGDKFIALSPNQIHSLDGQVFLENYITGQIKKAKTHDIDDSRYGFSSWGIKLSSLKEMGIDFRTLLKKSAKKNELKQLDQKIKTLHEKIMSSFESNDRIEFSALTKEVIALSRELFSSTPSAEEYSRMELLMPYSDLLMKKITAENEAKLVAEYIYELSKLVKQFKSFHYNPFESVLFRLFTGVLQSPTVFDSDVKRYLIYKSGLNVGFKSPLRLKFSKEINNENKIEGFDVDMNSLSYKTKEIVRFIEDSFGSKSNGKSSKNANLRIKLLEKVINGNNIKLSKEEIEIILSKISDVELLRKTLFLVFGFGVETIESNKEFYIVDSFNDGIAKVNKREQVIQVFSPDRTKTVIFEGDNYESIKGRYVSDFDRKILLQILSDKGTYDRNARLNTSYPDYERY